MRALLASLLLWIASLAQAELNQTKEQILQAHKDAQHATFGKNDTAIAFVDNGIAYLAMIYNGVSQCEVQYRLDGKEIPRVDINKKLRKYGRNWIPLDSGEDKVRAIVSMNSDVLSTYGYSKNLDRNYVLAIFTKEWLAFAAEQQEKRTKI